MVHRRLFGALIGLALLGLIASACGAAATPAAPPTTAPQVVASPTTAAAPPTAVPVPPTPLPPTPVPPTPLPVAPTPTAVPPSATPAVATPTRVAASATPVPATATKAAAAPTATPAVEVPRPSNAGGPGQAVNLKGDIKNGVAVFNSKAQDKNCATCHGPEGKGNVVNAGSSDGTVPGLNPIDEALKDKDAKVFATNIDLFIEHGSTPGGPSPQLLMPAWGDEKKLSPQEIADVIAYVMSLNP